MLPRSAWMVWNIFVDSVLDGRYRNFSVRLLAPAAASIDLALAGLYGYGSKPDGTSCAPLIPGGRMWVSGGLTPPPLGSSYRRSRGDPYLRCSRAGALLCTLALFGESLLYPSYTG